MSGFMSYLSKINNNLVEDDEDDVDVKVIDNDEIEEEEEIEEPKTKTVKKPQSVNNNDKKSKAVDKSVIVVEGRIRDKLDDIGLSSKLIDEVVSFVLGGVNSISNLQSNVSSNMHHHNMNNVSENNITSYMRKNDISGAAAYILEDVPEMDSSIGMSRSNSSNLGVNNLSSVADHASSLL